MVQIYKDKRGFFTLVGLLLTLVIISFLFYIVFNIYFKSPFLDKKAEKPLSEQGIDTTNYQTILDNTRKKVKDINKQLLDREKRLEDFR